MNMPGYSREPWGASTASQIAEFWAIRRESKQAQLGSRQHRGVREPAHFGTLTTRHARARVLSSCMQPRAMGSRRRRRVRAVQPGGGGRARRRGRGRRGRYSVRRKGRRRPELDLNERPLGGEEAVGAGAGFAERGADEVRVLGYMCGMKYTGHRYQVVTVHGKYKLKQKGEARTKLVMRKETLSSGAGRA